MSLTKITTNPKLINIHLPSFQALFPDHQAKKQKCIPEAKNHSEVSHKHNFPCISNKKVIERSCKKGKIRDKIIIVHFKGVNFKGRKFGERKAKG